MRWLLNGRGAAGHVVVLAAAGLIQLAGAYHDDRLIVRGRVIVNQALGARGLFAADGADGMQLGDVLSQRHELRHGSKRLAAKILVKPGHNHAHPAGRHALANGAYLRPKELGLVHRHHGGIRSDERDDLIGSVNGGGLKLAAGVRRDFFQAVAVVDDGLEHLNALARDAGTPQPADKLIGLAAEHGASNDLNRTGRVLHGRCHSKRKGRCGPVSGGICPYELLRASTQAGWSWRAAKRITRRRAPARALPPRPGSRARAGASSGRSGSCGQSLPGSTAPHRRRPAARRPGRWWSARPGSGRPRRERPAQAWKLAGRARSWWPRARWPGRGTGRGSPASYRTDPPGLRCRPCAAHRCRTGGTARTCRCGSLLWWSRCARCCRTSK